MGNIIIFVLQTSLLYGTKKLPQVILAKLLYFENSLKTNNYRISSLLKVDGFNISRKNYIISTSLVVCMNTFKAISPFLFIAEK